MREFYARFVCF
jgi:predicted nucleic acid-binding protein